MPDPAIPIVDRRRFLQSVTGMLTGVLGALGPLAALVPSRAWALELHALSNDQAAALLAAIRTIAPHDGLDSAAYAAFFRSANAEARPVSRLPCPSMISTGRPLARMTLPLAAR